MISLNAQRFLTSTLCITPTNLSTLTPLHQTVNVSDEYKPDQSTAIKRLIRIAKPRVQPTLFNDKPYTYIYDQENQRERERRSPAQIPLRIPPPPHPDDPFDPRNRRGQNEDPKPKKDVPRGYEIIDYTV